MPPRLRWIGLALALTGAIAFAFGVQTAWWTVGEVTVGPFGARHCFGGECRESGFAWLGGADLWMRSGIATRAGGYIAMFVLIVLAGALAAKRNPTLMPRAALVAIITAAASGGYFFAGFPGLGDASISYGLILFVAGVVLGIAGAIVTLRGSARAAG